jgi:hypothetical protein
MVVHPGNHCDFGPGRVSHMAVTQHRGNNVVAVGKNVGSDVYSFPGSPLYRKPAAVHLWLDRLNDSSAASFPRNAFGGLSRRALLFRLNQGVYEHVMLHLSGDAVTQLGFVPS